VNEEMIEPEPRALPLEIGRLIQHVELSESDWWQRALERLVTVALWLDGPLESSAVCLRLEQCLGTGHLQLRIDDILGRLVASGEVHELGPGVFKVGEDVGRALHDEQDHMIALEARLQDRLGQLFVEQDLPVGPEEAWEDFDLLFLTPLLADLGARLYELLATGVAGLESSPRGYGEIVAPLTTKYGDGVRSALVEFLDPTNHDVRQFLLRRLNGQYAREAAAVDDAVLKSLTHDRARRPRVKLFLDTNFVLSVLELHDNPENEGIRDFLALVPEIKEHVEIALYVLPITVDETRHVVQGAISRLTGLVLSRSVATAASAGGGVAGNGLDRRYIQAAASAASRSLTPQTFFGPYETDTMLLLRERGVELFNESLDSLRTDQEVIDDMHDQEEVQRRVRRDGAKPYETNLHDMVLWQFVRRHRPVLVESPLEAEFWIATLDYGLVSFDRSKRVRKGRHGPPICMTPAALIQLFRFWVPRTDLLDKALVGSIREPLLFLDFDRAAEKVTLEILSAMSRFEASDDLSPTLIRRVVMNKRLRSEMAQSSEFPEGANSLIESAVLEEAKRLEQEFAALELEKAEAQRRLDETVARQEEDAARAREQSGQTTAELGEKDAAVARAEQEARTLRSDLAASRAEQEATLASVRATNERLDAIEVLARSQRARRRVAVVAVTTGFLIAALVVLVALLTRSYFTVAAVPWAGAMVIGSLLWLLCVEFACRREPVLSDLPIVKRLVQLRRGLLTAVLAVLASLVATAIWQSRAQASSPQVNIGDLAERLQNVKGAAGPFTADSTTMQVIGASRLHTESASGSASILDVRPGDRVDLMIEMHNVGQATSPNVWVFIMVPKEVSVQKGTSKVYTGTYPQGDRLERDAGNHWIALGTFGPRSAGYLTVEVKVDTDFVCGVTSVPVGMFGNSTAASTGEGRSEVVLRVRNFC
jgi:hypothetical protein